MEIITKSAQQTQKLGEEFANNLVKISENKPEGIVIALFGDLGSGKTTFTQGLAKGLGIKDRVISPTFILTRQYRLEKTGGNLYHLDLYRIGSDKEAFNLGFQDDWKTKGNIFVIEWPEKIKEILPKDKIEIYFEHINKNERQIKIIH